MPREPIATVEAVLRETASREVRRVPPSELQAILRAVNEKTRYRAPEPEAGGARQDWWAFAMHVFAVAGFVKAVVDVYIALEKRLGQKPQIEEVKKDSAEAAAGWDVSNSDEIVVVVIRVMESGR